MAKYTIKTISKVFKFLFNQEFVIESPQASFTWKLQSLNLTYSAMMLARTFSLCMAGMAVQYCVYRMNRSSLIHLGGI